MVEQGEELAKRKVLPDYTNGLFPTWSGSSSRRASAAAFSDFICIFAMPDEVLFDYFFATLS